MTSDCLVMPHLELESKCGSGLSKSFSLFPLILCSLIGVSLLQVLLREFRTAVSSDYIEVS